MLTQSCSRDHSADQSLRTLDLHSNRNLNLGSLCYITVCTTATCRSRHLQPATHPPTLCSQVLESPLCIKMFVRRLQHFQSTPHSDFALILRNTHHSKAGFIFRHTPIIHSPEIHQRVPRLFGMLLRRVGIHIGNLTTRTASDDVQIESV